MDEVPFAPWCLWKLQGLRREDLSVTRLAPLPAIDRAEQDAAASVRSVKAYALDGRHRAVGCPFQVFRKRAASSSSNVADGAPAFAGLRGLSPSICKVMEANRGVTRAIASGRTRLPMPIKSQAPSMASASALSEREQGMILASMSALTARLTILRSRLRRSAAFRRNPSVSSGLSLASFERRHDGGQRFERRSSSSLVTANVNRNCGKEGQLMVLSDALRDWASGGSTRVVL